ncbi:MAG: hypothetical protein IPJ88_10145 [Myxococcales bacterium]|nr:MAG: hypothetical protein IPJ88_10145 [Myxococcales bacterium]
MVLAMGDLLPVDAELLDEQSLFSLDWINGESEARPYKQGMRVPAGSFHIAEHSVQLKAVQSFDDSVLVSLLRNPALD